MSAPLGLGGQPERVPTSEVIRGTQPVPTRSAERSALTQQSMQQTIDAMKKRERFAEHTEAQALQTCSTLTERLQQCDLTINFNAASFFKVKNTSASYQQMFERTGLVYTGAMLGGGSTSKAAYNRNTKQVFAALNFGRNPHGPSIRYGMSYFVLNRKFKPRARFFAGSTYLHESEHQCSPEDHVGFDTLAAVYGIADGKSAALRDALEAACFDRQTLPDNVLACEKQLIEAHLSEQLMFAGGIEAIYLSPLPVATLDRTRQGPPLYGKQWTDVQEHAGDFAWRVGAELIILKD